jgi:histone H3/H4
MRQKSKPRKYVQPVLKLKGKQQPVAILDDEAIQDIEPMVTANEQEQQQQEYVVSETEEIAEGDNDEHEPIDEEEIESEEDVDTDDLVESDEDENELEHDNQGENDDDNQGEDEEADEEQEAGNTKIKRRRVSAYQRSCKQIAAIRQEQRRTDLCISHAVMNRTIREIASDYRRELRFETDAIEILHHISEDLLVQIFHNSNNLAIHANKQSIDPSDIQLALLSNDAWKYLYTPSDGNKKRKYW